MSRRGLALALVCAVGCGGAKPAAAPTPVPERAITAGDPLLAALPAGAQLVVELDVARLRANPTAGPVLAALAAAPLERRAGWAAAGGDTAELALAIAADAEVMVMASYRLGTAEAATLLALRGGSSVDAAVEVGDGIRVAGPPAWVDRARAAAAGQAASLAGDRRLLAVRAAAMPARAEGASVRVSALFEFDARVALASRFDLERVPTSLSVWGDVADDLALVALLGGEKPGEAKLLARAVDRWRRRVATWPAIRAVGLAAPLGAARVDADDRLARVILLVAPRRWSRIGAALLSAVRD